MSGNKFKKIPRPKANPNPNPKSRPIQDGSGEAIQVNAALQQKLDQAIGLHVQNELELAKALYLEILRVRPNAFEALHYLGVIHYQQGKFEEALRLIESAVHLFPSHSVSQCNLGNVYQALSRFEDAIRAYTRSVELNPQFSDAYFNMGVVLNALGSVEGALLCYSHALSLNPNYAAAYNNRGLTLIALHKAGVGEHAFELACMDYLRATQLNPSYADAFFNWGSALHSNKDLTQALDIYNIAVGLDPHFAIAFNNRGNVLQELGQFDTALESFTKALQLSPTLGAAFYNRGSLYQDHEMFELAKSDYDAALSNNPAMMEAFFNRGFVNEQLKRFDEARADFERAIELNPKYANAHFNLSLLLLKLNHFDAGWEHYEWRWQSDDFLGKYLKTSKPLWQTDSSANTVLVWDEQGVGDAVFFLPWLIRFVQEIRGQSSAPRQVICRVDERLLSLFKRSLPHINFLARQTALNEDLFDAHLPMASLPLALMQLQLGGSLGPGPSGFELSTPKPYLLADKSQATQFRAALAKPGELLIGVSWRSKNSKTGASRSVDLAALVQALNLPRVCLVNLQYGDVQTELEALPEKGLALISQIPGLDVMQDLDGLASLISACDLVVSVDNSTVHLSGALGVQTWVLLPLAADWRWGEDSNSTSVWYNCLTLLRQQTRRDWGSVLNRVSEMLNQLSRQVH